MSSILDPKFRYTNSLDTDLRKRFRKDELEWNLTLLNEVAEYLENHSDVVDGADGPRPNKAMDLLRDLETLIAKLK
jgi:hypothetical protein